MDIGVVFSWLMCVTYVISRVPQLLKIYKSGDVQDLSCLLFTFTCLGNFMQFLSLVVRPARRFTTSYLQATAPFFINALLCGLEDTWILVMIMRYSGNRRGEKGPQQEKIAGADEETPLMNSKQVEYGP